MNKIRKYKILLLLTFICYGLFSQDIQITLPSQIDRNLTYLNPAYTGYYETTVFSLMHRSTWLAFGNIKAAGRMFQNVEFQTPLKNQSIALGGMARNETEGGIHKNEAYLFYSHRIQIGDHDRLAFGIKLGGQFISLDQNLKLEEQIADPAFAAFENLTVPNAGFGISYYSKKYYGGISIPYLLNSEMLPDYKNYSFIVTGGGKLQINDDFRLEPQATFVYNLSSPFTYQIQVNVNFRDIFLAGVGYRAEDAIIFTAGYYLNQQISLNYSYDYNIGKLSTFSSGSHEIGLLFYLGYKVNTVSPIDF